MNKVTYNLNEFHAKDVHMHSKILDFINSEYDLGADALDSMRHILHNVGVRDMDQCLEHLKIISNPKYYPFTNKNVMENILHDGGLSMREGFQKWIKDVQENKIPTLSKIQNNYLGDNLAPSKGDVIYENHIIELIHYKPLCRDIYKEPLLISPPWINKYYILDINKEQSFIQYCLKEGIDVFIISWKSATYIDIDIGLEDYIIKGVEKSVSIINKPLHLLGFCVGGLAALIASIRNNHTQIKSLSLLATPVDFSHLHQMKQFITNENFSLYVDKIMSKGYQSGDDLFKMFCLLKSESLIFKNMVDQYYLNKEPIENDILYWNMDSINIPAKLHLEYLEKFLLKNQLIQGQYSIEQKKININNLTLPTFVVATEKDHIVPPASALALRTNGNNVEYILGGSGHIAGIINPPTQNKYHFSTYCHEKQEIVKHDGSWWGNWSSWIVKKMGGKHLAQKNDTFETLRPAPGKYAMNQINLNKYS
ncbi:MAG: hypothetical protein COY39_03970 [Alphaproteobacteria bacterium CG_4_10_14_0_8_um_filter_37_21]|nr:MAG: hypothetical protein COY39_03970 [Alphaproteobacteria bacterium CG_4_10_14_0_8_um_filter_37_21]